MVDIKTCPMKTSFSISFQVCNHERKLNCKGKWCETYLRRLLLRMVWWILGLRALLLRNLRKEKIQGKLAHLNVMAGDKKAYQRNSNWEIRRKKKAWGALFVTVHTRQRITQNAARSMH